MKVQVYGHYDSRGGTIAIPGDERTQTDPTYQALCGWEPDPEPTSPDLPPMVGDPRWKWTQEQIQEALDEDYLGAAELVHINDVLGQRDWWTKTTEERGGIEAQYEPHHEIPLETDLQDGAYDADLAHIEGSGGWVFGEVRHPDELARVKKELDDQAAAEGRPVVDWEPPIATLTWVPRSQVPSEMHEMMDALAPDWGDDAYGFILTEG